jgi:hypothetical protein
VFTPAFVALLCPRCAGRHAQSPALGRTEANPLFFTSYGRGPPLGARICPFLASGTGIGVLARSTNELLRLLLEVLVKGSAKFLFMSLL